MLIFTAIFFRSHLFSEENQLEKFLLDISGDIASIIGFLIYLEIIELNFCNLNYDLKENIIKRSIEERINAPGTEARIEKKPRLSGEIKTFSYIW